jgi:hypothetical protein
MDPETGIAEIRVNEVAANGVGTSRDVFIDRRT